jgi:hypothetical protein
MCNNGSRIVEHTVKVLDLYGDYLTIYGWMGAPSHDQPRGPYDRRVDRYVVIWAAAAVVAYVIAICLPVPTWLAAPIFILSIWRIVELFAYHLRTVLSGTGRRGGLLTVASSHRSVLGCDYLGAFYCSYGRGALPHARNGCQNRLVSPNAPRRPPTSTQNDGDARDR